MASSFLLLMDFGAHGVPLTALAYWSKGFRVTDRHGKDVNRRSFD